MKIGTDLDGTLVDVSKITKLACRMYGIPWEPPVSWDMDNYPEDVREEAKELFRDPFLMTSLEPYPESFATLKNWKADGHEIVIITSRKDNIPTKEYVHSIFPGVVDKIIISDHRKVEHFLREDIDYWVDDAPHGIEDAMRLEIPVCMISNADTTYNHYMRSSAPWVKSVDEIVL
jgi:hypothetical protein